VTYKGVIGCASTDAQRPSFHPLTPNPDRRSCTWVNSPRI